MKRDEHFQLPEPDAEAQAHSDLLCRLIQEEIEAAGGQVSFARYMELSLYAPGLGYYSAGKQKFGEAGDFLTAPEISPLFSHCVARQCGQVLESIGGGDILEFGAGSGAMALEILNNLEAVGNLPVNYRILETSADLRDRQRNMLQEQVPHLMPRISWLDHLPPEGFCGVVLANEVLDAMPIHRLVKTESGIREIYIGCDDDGRFIHQQGIISHASLTQAVDEVINAMGKDSFFSGYTFEINLAALSWISSIARLINRGMALIIDYGYPRQEYYHPQRGEGTLMCFYHHRAHKDPLILTGLQDITTHVDFTALAQTAHEQGLSISGYTTQAGFLEDCGIATMASFNDDDQHHSITLAQQIRKLMLPGEMGDMFKVMALTKGIECPLLGFRSRDYTYKL